MNTFGRHLLVEYRGCAPHRLDDLREVEAMMKRAALAAGATIVGATFHRFTPQGVSGVVVVQESHLSIHTWPEYGYAAVDFYTCGDCLPEAAHRLLVECLEPTSIEKIVVQRGMALRGQGMVLESHGVDEIGPLNESSSPTNGRTDAVCLREMSS